MLAPKRIVMIIASSRLFSARFFWPYFQVEAKCGMNSPLLTLSRQRVSWRLERLAQSMQAMPVWQTHFFPIHRGRPARHFTANR
jgi:hypothetical protein